MKAKVLITIIPCLFFFSIVLLAGCSGYFGLHYEGDVGFYSEPSDAKLYVNGFFEGKTPEYVSLDTNTQYIIEFKKAGYMTVTWRLSYKKPGGGWLIKGDNYPGPCKDCYMAKLQ